ncbi:MAG: hypothetical protein ABI581_18030 [Sediminibacterium sp.]
MKKIKPYYYLLFILLLVTCSKEVNRPLVFETESSTPVYTLSRDLGITTLSVTLVPVVTCYSYGRGETPKPCDIFIEITFHLSKPIENRLMVELVKARPDDWGNKELTGGSDSSMLVFDISPGTQTATFKTSFRNPDNYHISGLFTFGQIFIYDRID